MSFNETSIATVHATGSHFDVGFAVGTWFHSRISSFWNQSRTVQETLVPFYDSRQGRTVFEEFLAVSKKCFPEYVSELEGTAQGCGMPFEKIFLINITNEVETIQMPKERSDRGCSTVFVNTPEVRILAHNEDCEPAVSDFGFLVSVDIRRKTPQAGLVTCETEKFTAFTYPGGLPGIAFGFNGDGMVLTANTLFLKQVEFNAPPRAFLSRALLTSTDLRDCQRIAKNYGFGAACPYNANIASLNHDVMWSLETRPSSQECGTVLTEVAMEADPSKPCHYYHANSYQQMTVENSLVRTSTLKRLKRLRELPAPRTVPDVLSLLGDTADTEFPVYRTPRPTDGIQTAATGVFDLLQRTMSVYKGNPKDQSGPIVIIPM